MPNVWIAIEGPCCAGKSTLGTNLLNCLGADRVVLVPDYADFVGGGSGMPDPDPQSLVEELLALDRLLDIEVQRFSACQDLMTRDRLVLIDRSVVTLLGHCAGLDCRSEPHETVLDDALSFLQQDHRSVWPTHIIYLDVDGNTQNQRNRGKFPDGSIFMDPVFNEGFRGFFDSYFWALPGRSGMWLNGAGSQRDILSGAMRLIDSLSGQTSNEGVGLA